MCPECVESRLTKMARQMLLDIVDRSISFFIPLTCSSPSGIPYVFPSVQPLDEFTMKISQKFQQSARDDKIWWSFEYFPPRTAQVQTLDTTAVVA